MAAASAKLHLHLAADFFDHLVSKDVTRRIRGPRLRLRFDRNPATYDGLSFLGPGIFRRRAIPSLPCRSFRSGNSGEASDGRMAVVKDERESRQLKRKGALYAFKSMLVRLSGSDSRPAGQYRKYVEKTEEIFFSVSSTDSFSFSSLFRSIWYF
ncbi:hypothetical protein BHE74_00005773 [Ensete ventricosum]|uniref:Uncharacterized protein n=1 Tax=Ensete ventricosum TaxID=4639 RepID=A0A444F3E9_ENSVE|nr:hypothetical protein GW17_00018955 [Ensete ventricosum]RWW85534.1 hypothetical protein BHE74_00005773 [Ensete ventricosum]RZR70982.1 hypothetical protein BHM03_00002583 [Ensete ventricosum]